MVDAPPFTKLQCSRLTSDCYAGSEDFQPVDLSLLDSIGVGSAELDHLAPWLQPPFQGSEWFCLPSIPGSCFVTKAGVQWHQLSSLQLSFPRLKRSSHLSF
uniref:Uncharacterized protein n=1 Tax=Callithrix jacchus TaxID=9483 RepID=A0A8I3W530_CALJA